MKVYLVFEDDSTWMSGSGDFYGAFSSREKAQAYIDQHPEGSRKFPGVFGMAIKVCELDVPDEAE